MFSHAVKNKKPYHHDQNCRVGKLLAVRRMRSKQVNSILVEKTIAKNPPQSIAVQLELSMKNFVQLVHLNWHDRMLTTGKCPTHGHV
jgi:hypothetical protein